MLCSIFHDSSSLTDFSSCYMDNRIHTIGYAAALEYSGREFRDTFT
jgi:hypothetical protein